MSKSGKLTVNQKLLSYIVSLVLLGTAGQALCQNKLLVPDDPRLTQRILDDQTSWLLFLTGIQLTNQECQEYQQLVTKDWSRRGEGWKTWFLENVRCWNELKGLSAL